MNQRGDCENIECNAFMQGIAVRHCPFCGQRQTAARAAQQVSVVPQQATQSHAPGTPAAPPVGMFEAHIKSELSYPYCETSKFDALVRYGVKQLQLTESRAEMLLTLQLERMSAANEKKLLSELEGMLRNFTDDDKKLDKKEWNDALQDACRARHGYARGLDPAEADRFILDYCRRNKVRIKTGLFKWDVP
jgi:hypothetical protein